MYAYFRHFIKLNILIIGTPIEFYKLCVMVITMRKQTNISDIVDMIWVPGDDFVDEFRVEWETVR